MLSVCVLVQDSAASNRQSPEDSHFGAQMHKRKKAGGIDARQQLSPLLDVASLKTLHKEVSDQARSIQIALKKVARQVGAKKKRVSILQGVAVTILCMTDGSERAARSYVGIHSLQSMLEDPTFVETTMSQVLQIYKDMTMEDQDALCTAEAGSAQFTAFKRARRHVREFKLADWIEDHNMTRGIAPHTKNVAVKAQFLGMLSAEKQKIQVSKTVAAPLEKKMEHFVWQCAVSRSTLRGGYASEGCCWGRVVPFFGTKFQNLWL